MNATPETGTGGILHLTESEALGALEDAKGPVIVKVSTSWCVPCQFMEPTIQKAALEFAGRMRVIRLDGDHCVEFNRMHEVKSFPTLLFFRDGQLVAREIGLREPEELPRIIRQFLGLAIDVAPSSAELAFRAAYQHARAKVDEIMAPASAALSPHFEAIQPEWTAIQKDLSEDVAAGRLTEAAAGKRRMAEWKRLSASFDDECRALSEAQGRALVAFAALMRTPVADFAATMAGKPSRPGMDQVSCLPGDPFCSIGPRGAAAVGSTETK
jgi:thioredoxin 1